jgi:hypothetical protein
MSSMTNAAAQNGLDSILDTLGSASLLRVYDGTPPVDAGTALGANTLLAELALDTPDAFGNSTDGGGFALATAGPIAPDSSADNAGTPTFFRMATSGGVAVLQGTAGGPASGAEIEFSTVPFQQGGSVTMSIYTQKLFES